MKQGKSVKVKPTTRKITPRYISVSTARWIMIESKRDDQIRQQANIKASFERS
jgi:hypothetical protein